MSKLQIVFPGGAGGHWLSHLVYLLETNNTFSLNIPRNFHNYRMSQSVTIDHWKQGLGDWKIFSSVHSFNLYLQGVIKGPETQPTTFVEQFNKGIYEAAYKFSSQWHNDYVNKIDLHYDLMFTDQEEFIDELFEILSQAKIIFYPNREVVRSGIAQFKKTLPDPLDYYDNLDNLYWLYWCFGIMHHENLPGNIDYYNCTKDDLVKSILPRRDFFANYTKPLIL